MIKVSKDNLKFILKILELTLFPEGQLDQQVFDLYEETGLREFVQEVEDYKFQGENKHNCWLNSLQQAQIMITNGENF